MLLQVDLAPAQNIHANDPGALQQMVHALTGELLDTLAQPMLQSGFGLWRALAMLLVAWTGVRMALEGFSGSQAVRVIVAISVPRMMLHFYDRPLPGSAPPMTFPEAIVGGGTWIASQIAEDSLSSSWEWLTAFVTSAWGDFAAPFAEAEGGWDLMFGVLEVVQRITGGLTLAAMGFAMALIAMLVAAICWAQVIWAQFAIGIAAVLGPVFIPFLLFEPLAFLFWGWFRSMVTYSLYAAIAAAVLRVFLGAVQASTNQIWEHLGPDLESVAPLLMWVLSYFLLAIAGLLAAFKVPELAGSLVSGNAGGGGMLGAIAAAATAGKAAVAKARMK